MSERGLRLSCNTQINRLSMPLLEDILETVAAARHPGWQIQLTVPMGRAADEPDVLVQPYDLLELFPLLADAEEALRRARRAALAGQQHRLLRAVRVDAARAPLPRARRLVRGRARDARHRGQRRDQGLPVAADAARGRAATSATLSLQDIWERSEPLRFTRDRDDRDLWGFCRLLLRRGVHERLHVDELRHAGQGGQQPVLPPPCARDGAPGQARARRAVAAAPGEPFDHGMFGIVVEPLESGGPT